MNEPSIERPLRHLNDDALERDAEQFAQDMEFPDHLTDRIKDGAYVAKYADFYRIVAGENKSDNGAPVHLTDEERTAIKNETQSLFLQSRDMYITVLVCAIAALIQGWDETGLNAANLAWPRDVHLDCDRNHQYIIGLVNAAPYLSASLLGCPLTDPINSLFGRRGAIFFSAIWCFAAALGSACSQSWVELFICRLCLGVGMGIKAATVPVFAAESAQRFFRGSIVMNWQIWVAFGIFLGNTANLAVYKTDIAWRLQVGSAVVPVIPLFMLVFVAPESPRWYMKRGRPEDYRKAYASLRRLRATELQACRDLYFTHMQLQVENTALGQSNVRLDSVAGKTNIIKLGTRPFSKLRDLCTVPRLRRAVLASCIVMLAQQLCGINVVAFYSNSIFVSQGYASRQSCDRTPAIQSRTASTGSSGNMSLLNESALTDNRNALLYSWAYGLINTLFSLPAVKTIDTFGRRPLLLFSISNMAWTMLAAALCALIDAENTRKGLMAGFLYLFTAFYGPGQGPVPFTYSAEAYPLSHREVGMSVSVATNLFFAAVLTLLFPRMEQWGGATRALGVFAGLNVVALILVFLFVPETARKSLEGLTAVFNTPFRRHSTHQVTEVLPYRFKRHVLRHKETYIPNLYHAAFQGTDSVELKPVETDTTTSGAKVHSSDGRKRTETVGDDFLDPDLV